MKLAVIEYNAGNIKSVNFALKRLGVTADYTADAKRISLADKVIFPGVGEASSTMRFLRSKGLDKVIRDLKQPVLGICLGLQLLCRKSAENSTACLGVFPYEVLKFDRQASSGAVPYKVPHVGWNSISSLKGPLFKGLEEGSQVYFVHSYYAPMSERTVALCSYIDDFSAAIQKDNFFAVQFHPEKSGACGEVILRNFINL